MTIQVDGASKAAVAAVEKAGGKGVTPGETAPKESKKSKKAAADSGAASEGQE